MYVCISMITSISILQSAIYVSCLCFIRPVSLSRIRRAEKSDGQRGRPTLGCILEGPLIEHKLDTDWQGRLVSESVYMLVLNCGGLHWCSFGFLGSVYTLSLLH